MQVTTCHYGFALGPMESQKFCSSDRDNEANRGKGSMALVAFNFERDLLTLDKRILYSLLFQGSILFLLNADKFISYTSPKFKIQGFLFFILVPLAE